MVLDCDVWFNDLVNAVVQSRVLGILVLLAPFLARLPDACRLVMMLTGLSAQQRYEDCLVEKTMRRERLSTLTRQAACSDWLAGCQAMKS